MHNAIAHHPLTHAPAAIRPSWPAPPGLYTGHEVPWYGISLWLARVSCPGHAPSQLLAHLRAGGAWETEESLTQDKCYLATTKPSACYQRYSHTKSKTQHCTRYWEESELCPSWNQDNSFLLSQLRSVKMVEPQTKHLLPFEMSYNGFVILVQVL